MEQDNWYTNYFKKELLENKMDNIDEYLKLFEKNEVQETLSSKLDKMEETYEIQLENLKKICKDNKIINFESKTSLEIMQKQLEIIKIISKYSLQNNYLDYEFFKSSLELLLSLSSLLRTRLKQPKVFHEEELLLDNIPRCSYKFCNFRDSCIYNYNDKKNSICYQDHYVHNMVCADINVLLEYIKLKNAENKDHFFHNKEILKSINTLCYVIGHMENELRTKCMYQEKTEWEKFHISKKKVTKITKIIKKL